MAGSAHQSLDDLGLAHFVEHLVFNFRKENPFINKIYEEIQQSGGHINAETGVGSTVFTADIPIIKLSSCLELVSFCFLNPGFSERAINNERQIILNELDNQDDFWFKVYRKILGKHALTYSGIGTTKTLQRINKEKIKSFFKKNYVLNKMVLICVGGINHEKLIQQVKSKWKNLPVNEERKIYHGYPELKKKYTKVSEWIFGSSETIYGNGLWNTPERKQCFIK
jgi:predicted Zn-dependent peptidase